MDFGPRTGEKGRNSEKDQASRRHIRSGPSNDWVPGKRLNSKGERGFSRRLRPAPPPYSTLPPPGGGGGWSGGSASSFQRLRLTDAGAGARPPQLPSRGHRGPGRGLFPRLPQPRPFSVLRGSAGREESARRRQYTGSGRLRTHLGPSLRPRGYRRLQHCSSTDQSALSTCVSVYRSASQDEREPARAHSPPRR